MTDRIRETLYMKMAHLTLKMPSKIVADDSLISLLFFREKRKGFIFHMNHLLKQMIHMKYQALFSLKNNNNKTISEIRLLQL